VLGRVATSSFSANADQPHLHAGKASSTPYAVLEVDRHYLAQVLTRRTARGGFLKPLRDQLDRAKGGRHIGAALARH
jgi:hypothetical protein